MPDSIGSDVIDDEVDPVLSKGDGDAVFANISGNVWKARVELAPGLS